MNIKRYQELAARTAADSSDILNAILGLCGESGEIADIYKKHKYGGHDLNKNSIVDELGDLMWYAAELCRHLNVSLEDVLDKNIYKLECRYPDLRFTTEKSVHRNKEEEKNAQIKTKNV